MDALTKKKEPSACKEDIKWINERLQSLADALMESVDLDQESHDPVPLEGSHAVIPLILLPSSLAPAAPNLFARPSLFQVSGLRHEVHFNEGGEEQIPEMKGLREGVREFVAGRRRMGMLRCVMMRL